MLAVVVSSLLALPVLAADQTLLDDEDVWKLYSQFDGKMGDINDNQAAFVGVGIGGILNDQFDVGVAGYALSNDIKADEDGQHILRSFDHWYAGPTVGYTFLSAALIHLRVHSLFGYGEVHTHPKDASQREESNAFSVMEPGATAYINVSETFEFGLGLSYRWVDGFQEPDYSDEDFSGLLLQASLRITEF
jgi:hypothetical protein